MTDIRVTREAVEVLTILTDSPDVRTTRAAVEVLTTLTDSPDVRTTRIAVEVLTVGTGVTGSANIQLWINLL